MALLDAALAFALTLAALATVATIIMEIAIRFLGSKARDQVQMLWVLCDFIQDKMGVTALADDDNRWKLVRRVLQNPFAQSEMKRSVSWFSFIGPGSAPVYKDISLEHFLRRLLDDNDVQQTLGTTRDDLKNALSKLGTKYDEYAAAIATRFKERAMLASLFVGVLVAFFMNVDGVRLFQDYTRNPEVTNAVIRELEKSQAAERANGKTQTDAQVKDTLDELNKKLKWLGELSLPIGSAYFPYCASETDARKEKDDPKVPVDPLCAKYTAPQTFCDGLRLAFRTADGWAWFFKVLVTGLLIGLGAPFWYDVARRLGQVRTAFGASGSADQRHRGSDGKKEPVDRSKLLDDIVDGAF